MIDYILLMHDDARAEADDAAWARYFEHLHRSGAFEGGSSIGAGQCFRKDGEPGQASGHLSGFIRVKAADLDAAKAFLVGNPVYEQGGTVEIRELPHD
ncbi:MAG: hypothetical protein IPN84_11280 [Sphingomonadales bacterium]|jgi:hypothetical protein|nr:hypothetical protein [Sphingomonadales bacterium]